MFMLDGIVLAAFYFTQNNKWVCLLSYSVQYQVTVPGTITSVYLIQRGFVTMMRGRALLEALSQTTSVTNPVDKPPWKSRMSSRLTNAFLSWSGDFSLGHIMSILACLISQNHEKPELETEKREKWFSVPLS